MNSQKVVVINGKAVVKGAAPYKGSVVRPQKTTMRHQLLNRVDDPTKYIHSNDWWMERKFDGKRVFLSCQNGKVLGTSRTGLPVNIPLPIKHWMLSHTPTGKTMTLDGELVKNTFYAFDVVNYGGLDIRPLPFSERAAALSKIVTVDGVVRKSDIWKTAAQKAQALKTLLKERAEGVVFKRHNASYQSGRPNAGGCALKLKFVATATVRVVPKAKGQMKRSVSVAVNDNKALRNVGSVTIPPNFEVPKLGALVEVRYLYIPKDGHLVQPVYLGVRDDKTSPDSYTSLQFKGN